MKTLTPLPFDAAWPEIQRQLAHHRNLVLVAEPGAGKTTRFPAMLIASDIVYGKVAVLEPRRLAARAAASRIAAEREWPMKDMVGYSVRFDHQLSDATRLAFFTEGLFLKKLAHDPILKGYDAVVLDEFHERSRHTDLAIAALKELQMLERSDLRIIVMSATIDAEKISTFLSIDNIPAPIVNVPGRTFPVEIRMGREPLMMKTSRDWVERVAKYIRSVALGPQDRVGDILCFFPGVGEIHRTREVLESDASLSREFQILELHGSLSLDEQTRVLAPHPSDARARIVLSTNIAETSLTIDGVGTVIDTGLARVARADRLGFSQLHLERISQASAKQRMGRAGRQAPGIAYRLWSKLDENSFPPFDESELNRIDLADSLLDLYALGVSDPRSFDWFERPEPQRLHQALTLLVDLEALDASFRVTPIGKKMQQTGLSARAARLMVAARSGEVGANRAQVTTLAAVISAILTEKDFLLESERAASASTHECDLYLRASYLIGQNSKNPRGRIDFASLKTLRRVIEYHLESDSVSLEKAIESWDEKVIAALLLKAFPDRVAKRRRPKLPQARMTGGRGIELHSHSTVRESDLFFALKGDAGTSRISNDPLTTLASSLDRAWLEEMASDACGKKTAIIFDEDNLSVFKERVTMYRDLPLESGHREKPTADEAHQLLMDAAGTHQDLILRQEATAALKTRLDFLRRQHQNIDLAQENVDSAFADALAETLYGQTSLKSVTSEEGSENLAAAWERHLAAATKGLEQALREQAPSHFRAPTGNRFRITYPENQPPFLEVRLQELFGLAEHPKVSGQPLTFHLLGPNYRPVQVTADLPGFWKGSYFEVRKELRARYPKHSWPENPLEATPEAKGRRR